MYIKEINRRNKPGGDFQVEDVRVGRKTMHRVLFYPDWKIKTNASQWANSFKQRSLGKNICLKNS